MPPRLRESSVNPSSPVVSLPAPPPPAPPGSLPTRTIDAPEPPPPPDPTKQIAATALAIVARELDALAQRQAQPGAEPLKIWELGHLVGLVRAVKEAGPDVSIILREKIISLRGALPADSFKTVLKALAGGANARTG